MMGLPEGRKRFKIGVRILGPTVSAASRIIVRTDCQYSSGSSGTETILDFHRVMLLEPGAEDQQVDTEHRITSLSEMCVTS